MYKFFTIISLLLFTIVLKGQQHISRERLASFKTVQQMSSYLDSISFRNIGPSIMSGRVVDIEVNPSNTNEFFVAYASGGVWHTENNGISFSPIFDNEATHTIGDMAMNWQDNILWVGTGEVNASRSSYAGVGMYKTTDRGKTWQHMGLDETHHIGKILLHPTNKNIAWVAALGHLYTPNSDRGVYKTVDGGANWSKTLYINDTTGCVDLAIHPQNPDLLFASSWTRTRTAWHFNGSGTGSAIWRSENGGLQWEKVTTETSGFPQGNGVGRIGIALCRQQPDVLYALLDNNFHQEEKKEKKLKAADFLEMTQTNYFNLSDDALNQYLKENDYPNKYTAATVKKDVENGKYSVQDIGKWRMADADASLFETPVIGAEVYKSVDAGLSWSKTHQELLEGVYFTYGYYFGTIAVSPADPEKVWIAGYPILLSNNGGKHFEQKDGDNTHPDYHRIWINPSNDKHIIVANDGGINITYDEGEHWILCNSPAVGQFYTVAVDEATPYNVYGGLQDNGTWVGSSQHEETSAWLQNGQYGYKRLGGGDGMQVQVDTRDNQTVYVGYQFGNYMRKANGKTRNIKPVHDIGEQAYRFNWQTPIHLSRHNQDIFYFGSNKFHRSMNQGNSLATLSDELTTSSSRGNVPFATLTSIDESPMKFGLLYVGTDDGNIWRSDDVGYHWNNIGSSLPKKLWVSRVTASRHKEGRVYASLNGYRNDDFKPYLFVSENYGQDWQAVSNGLPAEPVNVIKEDPKDENIIYVGTDNGLYVSINRGATFFPWRGNLPRVAIHDIAIQARENEIVLGTHGRSVYIGKLDLVQQLSAVKDKALLVLEVAEQRYNKQLGKKWSSYAKPIKQEVVVSTYVKDGGNSIISIYNTKNRLLYQTNFMAGRGWNELKYDLSIAEDKVRYLATKPSMADDGKYYLTPGEYEIVITNAIGEEVSTILKLAEKE